MSRILAEVVKSVDLKAVLEKNVGTTIVAYSSRELEAELVGQVEEYDLGEEVAFLNVSERYISKKRLETFSSKKRFTDKEVSFLVKCLLWEVQTKKGLRHEIALFGEEYDLFNLVNGEGEYFSKVLEQAKKSRIVCVPHRFLTHEICKELDADSLIIEEALELEYSLMRATSKRISLDEFEAPLRIFKEEVPELSEEVDDLNGRLEIFFGVIGIYIEQTTDGSFGQDTTLDDIFRTSADGRKALDAVGSIEASYEKLTSTAKADNPLPQLLIKRLDELIDTLSSIMQLHPETLVSYHNEHVVLKHQLTFFGDLLEEIFKKFETVTLKDSALSLDGDFSFLKSALDLGGIWHTTPPVKCPAVTIPDHLPDHRNDAYNEAWTRHLSASVQREKGSLLALLSSRSMVEVGFDALGKTAPKETRVLAPGISGGFNKAVELFLDDPENSVLIGNMGLMRHINRLAPHLKTLIVQKIPFRYEPKRDFERYSAPKAMLTLKKWLVTAGEHGLSVTLLDPRLLKQRYCAPLLREME